MLGIKEEIRNLGKGVSEVTDLARRIRKSNKDSYVFWRLDY